MRYSVPLYASYAYITFSGAPSLVGYEDDCCISYTVTIVDVRSCTRCTRVPVGDPLPYEQQGSLLYML